MTFPLTPFWLTSPLTVTIAATETNEHTHMRIGVYDELSSKKRQNWFYRHAVGHDFPALRKENVAWSCEVRSHSFVTIIIASRFKKREEQGTGIAAITSRQPFLWTSELFSRSSKSLMRMRRGVIKKASQKTTRCERKKLPQSGSPAAPKTLTHSRIMDGYSF